MSLVPDDKPTDFHTQCPHVTHSRDLCDLTFAQVQSSALACPICRLHKDIILAVIDGHLPGLSEGPEDETAKEVILKNLVLQARTPYTDGNPYEPSFNIRDRNLWLQIFMERNGDKRSAIQGHEVPTALQLGRYTSSERAFQKARQWMNEYLSTHKCANISTGNLHPPPTRLVDVECFSKDPARLSDRVRLFETQKVEYPYVCLSHRWGGPEQRQLKATVRNIRDHMSGIWWDDLPTTFQDAVTICRNLNVRYIWIDSLCILQEFGGITPDEAETTRQDFAHENATMARTYRNSYFTISARADISTNMDSGIFSKVPIDCGKIRVPDDYGNSVTLYFRSNFMKLRRLRERRTDLERRGWTFQESILPSRVLHFGPFELEWRCNGRHTCECSHFEIDECRDLRWDRRQFLAHIAARAPENEEDRARDWWEDVIHEYSDGHLTNARDKLPALSGIAQLYRQACHDTYLAGLWKHSLVYSLCWYHTVTYEEEGSSYDSLGRRPAQYRAPSWSWASLGDDWSCYVWGGKGRQLVHPHSTVGPPRPVCTILEAFCQPETADPTGEVRFGSLDMEAELVSAKIGPPLWDRSSKYVAAWTIIDIDTNMSVCFFKPDCELADDHLSIGEQVYCTPLLESASGTGLERGCLVLKKLYANLYRRIGFCVLPGGQPWVWLMSSKLKEIADASCIFKAQDYTLDNKTRIMIV